MPLLQTLLIHTCTLKTSVDEDLYGVHRNREIDAISVVLCRVTKAQ